jgi:hypothetical protein
MRAKMKKLEKALERTREAFRDNYDSSHSGLPSYSDSFGAMGELARSLPEIKEKE